MNPAASLSPYEVFLENARDWHNNYVREHGNSAPPTPTLRPSVQDRDDEASTQRTYSPVSSDSSAPEIGNYASAPDRGSWVLNEETGEPVRIRNEADMSQAEYPVMLEDMAVPMPVPQAYSHHTSAPTPIAPQDPWMLMYERVKIQDTAMVEAYASDIDNLLIFAGLFSAILTAFLAQVYPQLQQDNTQLSAQILGDLSRQLHGIAVGSPVNATSAPSPSAPFTPPHSVIVVNALWYTSLLFALAPVLIGLFAKQWLREYLSWTRVAPHDLALHRRACRYDGFRRWKVKGIITALPALLQISLILFFAGLIVLLHTLSTVIQRLVASVVGLTLLCVVAMLVLPTIRTDCPYRSPLAWTVVEATLLIDRVTSRAKPFWMKRLQPVLAAVQKAPKKLVGARIVQAARDKLFGNLKVPPVTSQEKDVEQQITNPDPRAPHVTDTNVTNDQGKQAASHGNANRSFQQSNRTNVKKLVSEYLRQGSSWLRTRWPKVLVIRRPVDRSRWKVTVPMLVPQQDQYPGFTMQSVVNALRVHIRPKGSGNTWDRRDSESQSMLGPVHDIAWKCRSILWVASHENVNEDFLQQSIRGLSCSHIVFEQSRNRNELFGGGDNPHRRMCAYWLAIAGHLDYKPQQLNDHMWEIFRYGFTNLDFHTSSHFPPQLSTLHRRLADLDPLERAAMFHLLSSGILSAIALEEPLPLPKPASPFTEEHLQAMYQMSLHFLRILCHRRSNLHLPYIRIVLRTIERYNRLPWREEVHRSYPGPEVCGKLLHDALSNVDSVSCGVADYCASVELATKIFENSVSGPDENEHDMLQNVAVWPVAHAVVSLVLPPFSRNSEVVEKVTSRFLQKVVEAMSRDIEYEYGRPKKPLLGPNDPRSTFIPRLITFCGRHKGAVPLDLAEVMCLARVKRFFNVFDWKYEKYWNAHLSDQALRRRKSLEILHNNGLVFKLPNNERSDDENGAQDAESIAISMFEGEPIS